MSGLASRALPEFRFYQPRPGHPDWPRLREEAVLLAAGLRPHLERPPGGAPELRRRLRSCTTVIRNFLTDRRLERAGREDLRPLYFIWTLLRSCNFRCEYCDDHRGRRYPDPPREGALDAEQGMALLRTMRTRTPSLYFSGGEPTLRRDLPELTRAGWGLGYYPIIVNTNAGALDRLLERETWGDWLARIDIVVVSLDALDLAVLERMWGHRRPDRVVRNLLLLRELAGEMRVKLLVPPAIHHSALDARLLGRDPALPSYADPWLSWLPFAPALLVYWALFGLDRRDRRLIAIAGLCAPLIEIAYIDLGRLHHYHLGWLFGVPVWIALWWVLAILVFKDLAFRAQRIVEVGEKRSAADRPARGS